MKMTTFVARLLLARTVLHRTAFVSSILCGILLVGSAVALAPAADAATGNNGAAPVRDVGAHEESAASEDALSPMPSSTMVRDAASPLNDFVDVQLPPRVDISVHKVTIALVAPQGTTPSFSVDDARSSFDVVQRFYDRETGGVIHFELENLVDWQTVDEPISCHDMGGLLDWVSNKVGWQREPARHLVIMVPPGDPCPDQANGDQPGDPDDGGRTKQSGPDAILLAHELGHNLALSHAASVQCATSWDYTPGMSCPREEYGNGTDIMGDSWKFTPLSSATLARLGLISNTREPACGAPRTAVLDSLGAGPGTPRALTWTDPADVHARYWLQYNDRNDEDSAAGVYSSQWATPRTVSGVQIIRTNNGAAGELLQRPGDNTVANEFIAAGETVALNSGMTVHVDAIDEATRQATVTVDVPCIQYVGNIVDYATVTASYTSPWATIDEARDRNDSTAWGTWPRVGDQSIELTWPQVVTIDQVGTRFASDHNDDDRQGLIPPRSWRVEYLDTASQSWKPVTQMSGAERERDIVNIAAFDRVDTTSLRVTYQAWGDGEYGGSTGVAELSVNGVAPEVHAEDVSVSGTARVDAVLTASGAPWGPATVDMAYQWKVAGVAITGATAQTYRPTAADIGKTVSVTATGSKPGYAAVSRESSPTAAVVAATLTTATPTITGTALVGETLTVNPGTWGPGAVSLAYKWFAGGVAISGATASSLVVPASANGKTITVKVTGTKPGYSSATRTSPSTAAVAPGTLSTTTPTISGAARVGATLTASASGWGPSPVALTYQWAVNGVAVAGATSATYQPKTSDVGKSVTVTVTGTKTGYASASRTSKGTGAVVR